LTAKAWYRKFCAEYNKNRRLQNLENRLFQGGSYSGEEKEWTEAMRDFLESMGTSMGYQVEKESRAFGGKRADQRWLKGKGSAVAIEHENVNNENLMGEITKLCNDVSPLKILITYVSDKTFKSNVEKEIQRVKKAIDDHIDTFSGQFLLVVSGWYTEPRKSSWQAYRSVLSCNLERVK
jgi:hypothetical protein